MTRSPISFQALIALPAVMAATGAAAATPPAEVRNFVACPIVQDTATVPCWIAKSGGETYYLGIQSDIGGDWYPPQLNHQVLVEGAVSKGPRICGGIVLKPIKTSVLPEVDKSCNTILPAKASLKVHAERGPGPSGIKPADPSKPAAPPERRPPPPPAPLQPPFQPRSFDVPFDFDGEYMFIRTSAVVGQAMRYAETVKAKKIEVIGYRGQVLLSDGNPLVERADMAERRAKKVARALRDIGVSPSITTVTWKAEAEPADGVEDWKTRRVVIRVEP